MVKNFYQILASNTHRKKKVRTKTINLEYQIQCGMTDLPDGSYSVSVIQNCFEKLIKKHGQ